MEKTFTYKIRPIKMPGGKEEIDTGFTGEIKVKIPDYATRMKMVKEQSTLGDDFEKISIAALETCSKFVESMDLQHNGIEGGISNINDLSMYQEGVGIMFDVYNQILQGWSLSPKNLKS